MGSTSSSLTQGHSVLPGSVPMVSTSRVDHGRALAFFMRLSSTDPAVLSTGPADGQAGLRQGDMLLCVAGLSVSGRSMDEVEQMLDDGPPGSTVTMILQRGGCGAIVASLVRAAQDDTMQHDLYVPPRDVQRDCPSPECRGGLTDGPGCSVDNSRVDDSTSIDSLSDFRTRLESWCVHAQPCTPYRIYAVVDVR